jgi:hypothetical protein
MRRYVIERDMPAIGQASVENVKAAARTSNAALVTRTQDAVAWTAYRRPACESRRALTMHVQEYRSEVPMISSQRMNGRSEGGQLGERRAQASRPLPWASEDATVSH